MREFETRDVFVAGGMPRVTYVQRPELELELRFSGLLRDRHKLICLTGLTKSGKTVLYRRVIEKKSRVVVHAGHVKTLDQFLSKVLAELDLPNSTSVDSSTSVSAGLTQLVSLRARLSTKSVLHFTNNDIGCLFDHIRGSGLSLIVDDFHYLPSQLQQDLVRSLKGELFDGLSVVFVAVPHRAFDVIRAEPEMEGRFSHLRVPMWSRGDLAKIPELGFEALNVGLSENSLRRFVDESIGNPLLMQTFCLDICGHYGIERTLDGHRNYDPSDQQIQSLFSRICDSVGRHAFDTLARGPSSSVQRKRRRVKDTQLGLDIYQALLRAIAETGPVPALSYVQIRDSLRQILVGTDMPNKSEIMSALRSMSKIARTNATGDPWVELYEEAFNLLDPNLMFFLKWSSETQRLKASPQPLSKTERDKQTDKWWLQS